MGTGFWRRATPWAVKLGIKEWGVSMGDTKEIIVGGALVVTVEEVCTIAR